VVKKIILKSFFYLFVSINISYAPYQANEFDRSVSKGLLCCCIGLSLSCILGTNNKNSDVSRQNISFNRPVLQTKIMGDGGDIQKIKDKKI
jgi:hypothetical protein